MDRPPSISERRGGFVFFSREGRKVYQARVAGPTEEIRRINQIMAYSYRPTMRAPSGGFSEGGKDEGSRASGPRVRGAPATPATVSIEATAVCIRWRQAE